MKEIRIEVRPQLLARMHDALRACPGFPGMTVGTVKAYPPSPAGTPRLKEDLTEFVQRVRIEIVTSDEQAEVFYEAAVRVLEHGQTGESSVRMTEVARATFLHRR